MKDKPKMLKAFLQACWWLADDKSPTVMDPPVGSAKPVVYFHPEVVKCSSYSLKKDEVEALEAIDSGVEKTMMEVVLPDGKRMYLQPRKAMMPVKSKPHALFSAKYKSCKGFATLSTTTLSKCSCSVSLC